ncbi:hypothetical protein BOH72_01715 [Mycobacterium sp. WY10]|nr:hypothetical protein BOH72_01715 [Mycobacterium sp. WY10]
MRPPGRQLKWRELPRCGTYQPAVPATIVELENGWAQRGPGDTRTLTPLPDSCSAISLLGPLPVLAHSQRMLFYSQFISVSLSPYTSH